MPQSKSLRKNCENIERGKTNSIRGQRGAKQIVCLHYKANTDRQIEKQIHEIDY